MDEFEIEEIDKRIYSVMAAQAPPLQQATHCSGGPRAAIEPTDAYRTEQLPLFYIEFLLLIVLSVFLCRQQCWVLLAKKCQPPEMHSRRMR